METQISDLSVETTLLMLVIDQDCDIANYSIKSYRKLWKIYKGFRLRVFANCLSDGNKRRYFKKWKKLPFVILVDNEKSSRIRRKKGDLFKTPEGMEMPYEGNCEHQEQIWGREHRNCKTSFFGTVDADFELLNGKFIPAIISILKADNRLIGCSTDCTLKEKNYFDSYSGRNVILTERWHTWCCIYKKESANYLDEVSPHYFEKASSDGTPRVYDSYAHFQSLLRNKYNYKFAVLEKKYKSQHIHYGAFSKNRSLGRVSIRPYRWLAIAAGPGLIRKNGKMARWLNPIVAKWARKAHFRFYVQTVKERSVNDFE